MSVLLFSDDSIVAIPFTHNKTTFTEYLRFPHHTTRIINGIEFDDIVPGTGNDVFKPDQGHYDGLYVRLAALLLSHAHRVCAWCWPGALSVEKGCLSGLGVVLNVGLAAAAELCGVACLCFWRTVHVTQITSIRCRCAWVACACIV